MAALNEVAASGTISISAMKPTMKKRPVRRSVRTGFRTLLSKLGFRRRVEIVGDNWDMKREPVESTTMRSVGYEGRSQILEIEFQSGAV